ncbi:MAG: alpha-keto acid decarboxylase family protein, partial [Planctomycetota bacterium]|nr:alpha-keto acid decarboxylase family protein [Planctomycetota bacterium]
MTDINMGIFTAHLDISRTINANSERIGIRHHQFEGFGLRDFLRGLIASPIGRRCTTCVPPQAT